MIQAPPFHQASGRTRTPAAAAAAASKQKSTQIRYPSGLVRCCSRSRGRSCRARRRGRRPRRRRGRGRARRLGGIRPGQPSPPPAAAAAAAAPSRPLQTHHASSRKFRIRASRLMDGWGWLSSSAGPPARMEISLFEILEVEDDEQQKG